MADRQDIDALMVGALYGELDAAESVRLETHLSSHPEDRAAMQGLERTRATLRRGIEDMPSAEPPQAISAVLLQAAARRAPARAAAATEPEGDGMWARFVDWFRRGAMHPAVAAAAVLVLVAGTATALWVRGKGGVTEPTADRHAAAPSAEAEHAPAAAATAPSQAAGSGSAGADLYDVDTANADEVLGASLDEQAKSEEANQVARSGKGSAPGAKEGRSRDKNAAGYLEVDGVDKAPPLKDMPSSDDELKLDTPADEDQAGDGAKRDERGATSGAAGGGGAGKAAAPSPEPRSDDPADEQWARTAHTRLVKLVSDGKCPEAGRLGAEIKDRAPEYYAANVANDRDIRQCKQYIESRAKKKAEKAYKSRSQQNTYDDAADSPSN